MEMYLEADSILKSYGERVILSDVYLKCEIGDRMAIWGRNGSGKSTLFRIIFGTERAERSFIRINDKVITGKAYQTGMLTYLPQFDYLPKEMEVKTFFKGKEMNNLPVGAANLLERIYTSRVRDLSGGELRFLEVILILESDVPFVILDEPFTGLSPVVIEEMCDYINGFSKTKGIILADHNYRMVEQMANKHMLLNDGYLRLINTLDELEGVYLLR